MNIRGYGDAALVAGCSHIYNFSTSRREIKVQCPKCGKSMWVNINKGTHNCFHCGFGGTVIDFYAALVGIEEGSIEETRRLAGKDFNERVVNGSEPLRRELKKEFPKATETTEYPLADIDTRSKAYNRFLDMLNLEDKHKKNLLKRGLTEKDINKNRYKSMPLIGMNNICEELQSCGISLEGVPGFYQDNQKNWHFIKCRPGFLIPVREILTERIQSLQLRTEEVEGDEKIPRYLTISSSGYQGGCKGRTFPHFNPGYGIASKKLIITEGPLKADVVSAVKGYASIGVLGVNCLDYLFNLLSEVRHHGYKKVYIAYDMDMYHNENVMKAYKRLKQIIVSSGLSIATMEWDVQYKGLDDYLTRNM